MGVESDVEMDLAEEVRQFVRKFWERGAIVFVSH